MGNLLGIVVHAANIHDTKSGILAAQKACKKYPSIQAFCADAGYRGTCIDEVKVTPHNSAARLAMSFPPSAACKFLDLPPVNLRNLHLHLTKNPFASRMFERNLRSNSSRQGTGGGHLTRWEPPAAKGAMRFFAASLPENVSLCRSHISSADGYHPVHVYLESTSMGKSPRIKPAS